MWKPFLQNLYAKKLLIALSYNDWFGEMSASDKQYVITG